MEKLRRLATSMVCGLKRGRPAHGADVGPRKLLHLAVSLLLLAAVCAGPALAGADRGPRPSLRRGHESRAVIARARRFARSTAPLVARRGNRGDRTAGRAPGRLVSRLSRANMRTYALPGHSLVSRVFPTQVNYRDRSGWHPIDNRLGRSGTGYRNRANSYSLRLPADIGTGPVTVSRGGSSLGLALEGASGPGAVDGARVSYADALPHASVGYSALGQAVKETVTLDGRSAPSRFTYDLSAGDLRARSARGGAVELVGADGRVRFRIERPFMYEYADPAKAHSVSMQLVRAHGRERLVIDATGAWLRQALRHGRVVIDPTVDFGPAPDCHLESDNPDTNFCGSTQIEVGWDGVGENRGLLKFDLSSIPKDAIVLNAKLALHAFTESSTSSKSVSVYRATKSWTGSATWNKYDGTNAWTTAGGDFDSNTNVVTNPSVGGTLGWYYWYPTRMVQDWVSGAQSNQGMLVKDTTNRAVTNKVEFESSHSTTTANLPYLEVVYQPRAGVVSSYKYESQSLDDKANFGVDVTNGNFVLHSKDVKLAGTNSFDMVLDRYWNSAWTNTYTIGSFANGQTGTDTADVWLHIFGDGSVGFYRGDGAAFPYIVNSGGNTFQTPADINADLVKNSDGTYTLTFRKSNAKYKFDSSGQLTSMTDRQGNKITLSRTAGALSSISDTQGHAVNVTTNANKQITDLSDPAGRTWHYGYTGGELTSYTDPNGKITQYHWNGGGYIDQITTPAGNVTKIGYDASNRVSSITRTTDAGHTTGPTTSFYYGSGSPCQSGETRTIVTDPDYTGAVPPSPQTAHTTTYCTNAKDQAKSVYDGGGNKRSYTYTSNGDVQDYTAPGLGTASFGYDNTSGNLLSMQYGGSSGPKTTLSYSDAAHPYQPSSSTNPELQTLSTIYNTNAGNGDPTKPPDGSTQQRTDGLATFNHANFTYRPTDGSVNAGTPQTTTDPDGNQTTYNYSGGNLTSLDYPTGSGLGTESLAYDSVSRPCVITDGKNQKLAYAYDKLDRVLSMTYYNAGATSSGCTVTGTVGATVTYTYDDDGNVKSLTDSHGTASYTYDPLNRLTNEALPGGGSNTYGYDAASNLTSLQDSGGTVTYGYNGSNQLSSETDPGATQSTTFSYNSDGQRTKTTYPSGVTVNYTFNSNSQRLTDVSNKGPSGNVLSSFHYVYTTSTTQPNCPAASVTDTDLVQQMTDNAGNTTTYCYDELNRLTYAKTAGPAAATYQYSYDGDGNRKTQTINGTTTSFSYDTGNKPTGTGWSFDAVGNETAAASGSTFGYNVLNQTTAITPSGGTTINRTYRGPGQADHISAGNVLLQNNVLGLGIRNAGTPINYFTRDNRGALIDERQGTATYNYLFDGQGSVVGLTDAQGTIENTYAYDPYGNTTSSTGTVTNVMRFEGGYYGTAQTYRFRERYYDPQYGRWTQQDPIDQTGDLKNGDRYIFAGDDPVNRADPSGMLSSFSTYAGQCVQSGAVGAAIDAADPAGSVATGFLGGCAEGVGTQLVSDVFGETAGQLAELAGGLHDAYKLADNGLNSLESAGSDLIDSVF